MKKILSLLALTACFGFSLPSHATDITYDINGSLATSGSFSGTFLIDSVSEVVDGGSITAIAPSGGSTYTFVNETVSGGGYGLFTDGSGDVFSLLLNGPLSTLAINTLNPWGSLDTHLIVSSGLRYDAVGGTVSAAVAPTPEPSSLLLLGTGALGLAGSLRRRFLKA